MIHNRPPCLNPTFPIKKSAPLLGRILAVPPTLPDEYKKRVEPGAKCLRGTTHVFIRSLNGSLTETTPAEPT